MRVPLRYYGGKARLSPWIIRHFPPHECYVESYGGGGAVLLSKPPARYEVYNDLDQEVVTFFRVLREQPDAFRQAVELTPYSRAEVRLSCSRPDPALPDLERARRFYVRSWQTRHGVPGTGQLGWRYERGTGRRAWSRTVVDAWCDTDRLLDAADRLRDVQIECDDALAVIQRFDAPGTLHYVDPPYPTETRSDRWKHHGYACELTTADHESLAALLHTVQGMVVVSGYPCPLYDRLYQDWPQVSCEVRTNGDRVGYERLWLSPATVGGSRQLALSLASDPGGDPGSLRSPTVSHHPREQPQPRRDQP